jgi:hypothetical protein
LGTTVPERPPTARPPIEEREVPPIKWACMIERFIHPAKVEIVEALVWIGQPLSGTELRKILGRKRYSLGTLIYHLEALRDIGVVHVAGVRAARGAREVYYLLDP